MIIIFGLRSRASVVTRGIFLCPHCGVDRNYAHKQMRRWFTLFFVPVIPLNVLGKFVECEACQHTYKPAVLQAPTTAMLQDQLLLAIREAAVTLDRVVRSPAADSDAIAVVTSFAGRQWTSEELDRDVTQLDTAELPAHLATLGGVLNEQGKERLVGACAHIAATGGVIDADGRGAIEQIAAGLLMTPAHVRGIIEQVLEGSRA